MPDESSERIARAKSASGKARLNSLIHETDEETLLALLENPHIEEPHVDSNARTPRSFRKRPHGHRRKREVDMPAKACGCAWRAIRARRADSRWRCSGSFICSIWFA